MASEQVRKENKGNEREVKVEKDLVPKMRSHFEALVVKEDTPSGRESSRVGGVEFSSGGKTEQDKERNVNLVKEKEEETARRNRESDEGGCNRSVGKFEVKESGGGVRGGGDGGLQIQDKRSDFEKGVQAQGRDRTGLGTTVGGGEKASQVQDKRIGLGGGGGVERRSQTQGGEHGGSGGAEGKGSRMHGKGGEYQTSTKMGSTMEGGGEEEEGPSPSLEEISKYRQAQQNSTESIRAAEERYAAKAKELGSSAFQNFKDSSRPVVDFAADKGIKAKDTVAQGVQTTAKMATEKGRALKDTALEKGAVAKDTVATIGKTTAEKTAQTAAQAKDYALEKAGQAKEAAASTGGYVGDKAVAAKDASIEGGKGVAGYAGKVATVVKDKATVASWGVAEYTLEKAVDATKAVAGATATVAGYAGQTAVAAKDVAANVGSAAKDFTVEKIGNVKDAVVATEESAKDYAARKKAEAERAAESKGEEGEVTNIKAGESMEESEYSRGEEEDRYFSAKPDGKMWGFEEMEYGANKQDGGGGVLGAITETLAEIGQTTTHLIAGQPRSHYGYQEQGEEGAAGGFAKKQQ